MSNPEHQIINQVWDEVNIGIRRKAPMPIFEQVDQQVISQILHQTFDQIILQTRTSVVSLIKDQLCLSHD